MKKSLKALILCGLASLAVFAIVFVSPVVTKAANLSTHSDVIYDEITCSPCGTVTYSWDSNVIDVMGFDPAFCGYWMDTEDVAALFIVSGTPLGSNPGNIQATYDFSFAGGHYSGTATLIYQSVNGGYDLYVFLAVVGSKGGAGAYFEQINDLKDMINIISGDSTLTGDDRVIEFSVGDSLPVEVIEALAKSNGVTLKFTFTYQGFEFCSTITSEAAKNGYNPAIGWYGPCYLAQNFPTVWTGKIA